MLHEMKLNPEPFEQIKAGTKTAEIRLYDEKRRLINVGDEIIFRKLPELNETIKTKVTGLTISSDFTNLFTLVTPVLGGWNPTDTSIMASSDMGKYYSKDDEYKFGVLAIHIKLI